MRKLLLLFLILFSPLLQAKVKAWVNKSTITEQETLQLTIEVDRKVNQRPDLSVLRRNFQVLTSKQMTISRHAAGNSHSSTRWYVLLQPRKAGSYSIPPILVEGDESKAIAITVMGQKAKVSGLSLQPLFMETSLNTNELYQDSQLLYTVRVFHQQELTTAASLSPPILKGALIKMLGETKHYETELRGAPYKVLERRYAIFPSTLGTHQLLSPLFKDRDQNNQPIQVKGDSHELAVLPQAFQSRRGYWLPASELKISDSWQQTPDATVNETIERTLTVSAVGLPASRLPSMTVMRNELAKIEVQEVILSEEAGPNGISSQRSEKVLITPAERGEITLPAIDIPWWNTELDRAQNSALPAKAFIALPAEEIGVEPENPQAEIVTAIPPVAPQKTSEATSTENRILIYLLAAVTMISALGWLYSWSAMRRLRQQQQLAEHEEHQWLLQQQQFEEEEQAEQLAFQEFANTCDSNNAEMARIDLIEWARCFWNDQQIKTTEEVSAAANSQTLNFLIIDLEHHLYEPDGEVWRGDLLLDAVSRIRQRQMFNSTS